MEPPSIEHICGDFVSNSSELIWSPDFRAHRASVHSMLDFVTLLRTAIGDAGIDAPGVRERFYQKARDAVGRIVEDRSPLEAENYRGSLEEAIVELERFYEGLPAARPTRSSDGENDVRQPDSEISLQTPAAPGPGWRGREDAMSCSPGGNADGAGSPSAKAEMSGNGNIGRADAGMRPPCRTSQTISYGLDWS